MNAHSIPSRMTIGHLMETLLGIKACECGLVLNGTPFRGVSADDINEQLIRKTFGREVFCDGATGKRLECTVFYGVVYYQRLKHETSTIAVLLDGLTLRSLPSPRKKQDSTVYILVFTPTSQNRFTFHLSHFTPVFVTFADKEAN